MRPLQRRHGSSIPRRPTACAATAAEGIRLIGATAGVDCCIVSPSISEGLGKW